MLVSIIPPSKLNPLSNCSHTDGKTRDNPSDKVGYQDSASSMPKALLMTILVRASDHEIDAEATHGLQYTELKLNTRPQDETPEEGEQL